MRRLASEHPLLRILTGLGLEVRVNRNRRTYLSLRQQKDRRWRMSIHEDLLAEEPCHPDLVRFARDHGRGDFPLLREAMTRLQDANIPIEPPTDLAHLPTLGSDFNFSACYDRIYSTWFSDLSKPPWHWSRDPGHRRLRSMRFGGYHFSERPLITLSPRLRQAWIATCFVEHVIHHELCHHRQRCRPMARENPHSPRFRTWEREFPDFDAAIAWERAHRERLLAPPSE